MIKRDEKIEDRGCAVWEKMSLPHGADWDHWLEVDLEDEAASRVSFTPKAAEFDRSVQTAA